jgi:PAS domain S-box-containing protein
MNLCEILKTNILERYETLINHAPVGILLIGLDGAIVELNPKVLEILGSPSEEETRKINMLDFPKLVEAGISELVKKSLSGSPLLINEVSYTSLWGKSAIIRFTAVPIYDEKQYVCFSLVIMEDMTPYNQLKIDLQKANSLLKTVINTIPSLVWMKDKDGKYIHSNKSFNEFNLFVGDDIIGKTDYDIWPKTQADSFCKDDIASMECSYPIEINESFIHPTLGLRHYKTTKIGVCDEHNNVIGSVGISCDVTKQVDQDKILADAIQTLTDSLNNNVYVK